MQKWDPPAQVGSAKANQFHKSPSGMSKPFVRRAATTGNDPQHRENTRKGRESSTHEDLSGH